MSGSHDTQTRELLAKEYFHLYESVSGYEHRMFTIKAWSVTVSMGAIGVAFLKGADIILLLGSLSAFLFWWMEGRWAAFQGANSRRLTEIETSFRSGGPPIDALQIATVWAAEYDRQTRVQRYRFMLYPHILLPHGVIVFFGLLLYFLDRD